MRCCVRRWPVPASGASSRSDLTCPQCARSQLNDMEQQAASLLESLPQPLLMQVLRHLPAEALLRVGATSRAAQLSAAADELWRRLAPPGAPPPPPGAARAAYCARRRARCVECGEPSRHVFAPLGVRLCAGCEAANPTRYSLATELEAEERFGVPPAALESLPSVFAMRRRWFLRTAVEALGGAGRRGGEGSGSGDGGSSDEGSGEGGEEGGAAGPSAPAAAEGAAVDVGRGGGEGGGEGGSEGAAAEELEGRLSSMGLQQQAERDARREERKVAKKQVKAEQRARRELKAQGLHWPGARPAAQRQQQHYHETGPSGGGGARRGPRLDGKKAKYMEHRHGQRKGAGEPVRGHAARREGSAWLEEREALLREYGVYDATGLVLADTGA
ncbi:MAG: hypothetical protein J3K34DRAFT_50470 [Monoraphidium minutum]|nr:MAG: hypothetical protein J3K34DRAFT_50470 [Monoraphidium minutum]